MMKLSGILMALCTFSLLLQNCKDPEPAPGVNFSGRLLVDCEHPEPVSGVVLSIWENTRILGPGDTLPAKLIGNTTTDADGYFVYRYTFDSVPMSLIMKDKDGEEVILASGVFGIHNIINSWNNTVADLLRDGNIAKGKFEITPPSSWSSGDSVVISLSHKHKPGAFSTTMYHGQMQSVLVEGIRAFNRVMDNQDKLTIRDRKFCFPVTATWYASGKPTEKTYLIPTQTCQPDLEQLFHIVF